MHCCTIVCSQVVLIASGSSFESVIDRDQYVLDPAVLQLGDHLQPEPRPLSVSSPAQMPRMSRSPFVVTPITAEIRGVADLPVPDLHR